MLICFNYWILLNHVDHFRTDDLTESLETEMQRAFESIKLSQGSLSHFGEIQKDPEPSLEASHVAIEVIEHNVTVSPVQVVNTQVEKVTNPKSCSLVPSRNSQEKPLPALNGSSKRIVDRDEVRVMQKVLGNEVGFLE